MNSTNVGLRATGFSFGDGDRPGVVYIVVDFVRTVVSVVNDPVLLGEDVCVSHYSWRMTKTVCPKKF